MAYFLQVKLQNGKYKSLDISKSDRFKPDNIYTKKIRICDDNFEIKIDNNAVKYSLQVIDHFTMQFEDEKELKLHLISSNILPPELMDNPLCIRFVSQKKMVRNYEVFFSEDYYYFEIDKLISLVETRYLVGDFKFLMALSKYFRDFRECTTTASELLALSTEAYQFGHIDKGFNEIDSNGDNIVRRLPKLLIYRYDTKRNGDPSYRDKVSDKDAVNWRTLHLLIEFIKNYEQKELKYHKEKESSLVKKLQPISNAKQNDELEFEQLSFKDLSGY